VRKTLKYLVVASDTLAGRTTDEALTDVLRAYRATVRDLLCLAAWTDYRENPEVSLRRDTSVPASNRLLLITGDIYKKYNGRMKRVLKKLRYFIDDSALLINITGEASGRIEHVGAGGRHICGHN
jgi:DNA polymerase III psi subunit